MHVECSSHCAITRQVPLPAVTITTNQKTQWRIAGAGRCREKKSSLSWWLNRLQLSFYKHNFVDVMGWRNSKKIKQRWSNSGRRLGGPLSASVTRRMRDPECCRDCKHRRRRGTAVIQRQYRSSEVSKSITDRNVYRWVTAKRWFSKHDQKRRQIRSVASDSLTKIYDTVALNVIQKQRKQVRKIAFTIKNEIEAEGLSRPKSTGILTVLRCISGPHLVIVAWTGDKLLYGQAQNEVKFDFQVEFDLESQDRSPPKITGI